MTPMVILAILGAAAHVLCQVNQGDAIEKSGSPRALGPEILPPREGNCHISTRESCVSVTRLEAGHDYTTEIGCQFDAIVSGALRRVLQPRSKAWQPVSLIAPAPFVEQGARDPEEAAGATHVVGDLFEVLEHAQAGGGPLGPFPIADHTLHPGPFADILDGTGAFRASAYKLDFSLSSVRTSSKSKRLPSLSCSIAGFTDAPDALADVSQGLLDDCFCDHTGRHSLNCAEKPRARLRPCALLSPQDPQLLRK